MSLCLPTGYIQVHYGRAMAGDRHLTGNSPGTDMPVWVDVPPEFVGDDVTNFHAVARKTP